MAAPLKASKPLLEHLYIGVLFLLLIAGGYSAFRESLPFLSFGGTQEEQKSALAMSVPQQALSDFSNRVYIRSCIQTLLNPLNPMLAPEPLAAAANNCLTFAQQQTSTSPANSYAYALTALSHVTLGDKTSAVSSLEKSRAIAPSEAWLAGLRLTQLRQFELSSVVSTPYIASQDIMTLGRTDIGRKWLAEWYMIDLPARATIVKGIDSLTDGDKRAFLQAVQR